MTRTPTKAMRLRSIAAELARRTARWCARAAVIGGLCALLLTLMRAPVQARVDDALMGIGAQMMRYQDALVQDEPRTVLVNGVALHLSAGATDDSVGEVLDEYQGRCTTEPDTAGQDHLPFGEALRAGDEARGFVACVDSGSALSADGLVDRARSFVASRDVTSLGALHYVYAERRGQQTHFIVFRADDELNIERMFPTAGDAPGEDAPGVARPPDSRRRFSLREVGYPYGITVYGGSPRSIAELERYYRGSLEADGWRIARRSPVSESVVDESHYIATRDGALTLVVFGNEPSGTSTTILTTTLQARGQTERAESQ